MPTYQLLTDRSLAQSSAITPTTLIHIVYTGDPSQNIAGSSYKAELGQLVGLFSGTSDTLVTGGTYSAGTITFTNNSGATFSVSGLTEPFSGGSGNCITDLYTSNIHSCSPLNINPLDEGNVYFGSTSGVTVDVINSRLGIGITNPVSKLTIVDGGIYAVGAGNSARIDLFDNQVGGSSITIDPQISLGVAGVKTNNNTSIILGTNNVERLIVTSTGLIGIGTQSPSETLDVSGKTKTINFQMTSGATNGYVLTSDVSGNASWQASTGGGTFTGGTVSGATNFTNGLTANTISATTYLNLPLDIRVTGGTYSAGTATFTNNTGGTFNVTGFTTGTTSSISGDYLPLSGGTVSGATNFTNGLTANTMSASTLFVNGVQITGDTYVTGLTFNTGNYNLTIGRNDGVTFTDNLGVLASDNTITGGTYNSLTGVGTFTNNTGGTFDVSGFLVGYTDVEVTGSTYNNNTFTFTNSTGGTFDVLFNTVTGLTSTGLISSNTISATTYQNLPPFVFTGGTVNGPTNFTNGLTANTISATTYLNLPQFSGGSGNCITDLYVTNVHGCSPITIYDSIRSTGSTVSGQSSISFGFQTSATTDYSHAEGGYTIASGYGSHAEGESTIASDVGSHAEGYQTSATTTYSHSEGTQTLASGSGSHAEGSTTIASGTNSHSEGFETSATTAYSHSEGQLTLASGYGSHAEGESTLALGSGSHAEGFQSSATTSYSHSEGVNTVASGYGSHTEGYKTSGTTDYSHSEGYETKVLGNYSHAEGGFTIASGLTSHAEGYNTGTYGDYSHSEGLNTIAVGVSSHAEGYLTQSRGNYSHAEGTSTVASGSSSHAEGVSTKSIGEGSHAEGHGTYTSGDYQHATGKWNLTGNTTQGAFIVGNGSDALNRSNLIFAANSGVTITGTLTATTISATTYQNLPLDIRITGATYSNNTFTHRNNTGGTYTVLFNTVTGLTVNGQLSVTGNTSLQGLTATTISATTYQNLPTDIRITGATYSNNTFTHRNNTGGTYTVLFNTVTGLTVNGNLTVTGSTNLKLLTATTTAINGNLTVTGNTGLGIISPLYPLDVSSGAVVLDEIVARFANTSNQGIYIAPTANGSSFNLNTQSGDVVLFGSPGESFTIGSQATYAGFRFSGGTSANTITTTGKLGIGIQYLDSAQQPTEGIDVNGSARFRVIGSTASAGALHYTANGTLTTNTSDQRLKENIEPLTNSLDKILQLSGVSYNWIGQEGKRIGMIAQEVEKVIPELVFTNNNTEDKIKGIHQDNLTAVLVEAIKEQQKIIEELKVRISNLES